MSDEDWREVGNRVYGILAQVFRNRRTFYQEQAHRRGIELEQFAGAAIASMVREYVEMKAGCKEPRAL
jgi:hypothetical protein